MKRLAATTFLTACLAGCATSAPAVHSAAAAPMEVSGADRDRYWTPAADRIARPLSGDASPGTFSRRVEVTYTIDGAGRVRDATAASFEPEGSNPGWAIEMIRANRFDAGPDNPQRRPIRTSTEVRLDGALPGTR